MEGIPMEPIIPRIVDQEESASIYCYDHGWIHINIDDLDEMMLNQGRIICPVCHKGAAMNVDLRKKKDDSDK